MPWFCHLESLNNFEQGAPHFCFAPSPADVVACPTCGHVLSSRYGSSALRPQMRGPLNFLGRETVRELVRWIQDQVAEWVRGREAEKGSLVGGGQGTGLWRGHRSHRLSLEMMGPLYYGVLQHQTARRRQTSNASRSVIWNLLFVVGRWGGGGGETLDVVWEQLDRLSSRFWTATQNWLDWDFWRVVF